MSSEIEPTNSSVEARHEREALERVIDAGVALANIAFNLKQSDMLDADIRSALAEWQNNWDDALREYRKAKSARGESSQ